jgi:rod shape-determining protein MreC
LVNKDASGSSRWFGEEGSRTAKLMMYILLAVVLMSMDQRGQYIPKIRSTMELAFEPVFVLVGWPSRAWTSLGEQTTARNELIASNQELQQALLKNAGSIQTLAALEQENQRLRKLLGTTQGRDYNFTFAEMIRVDLDPFSHKVWINLGEDQGVVTGQAVIDGLGIVGQIEEVFGDSSTVRLISDPDHALPVQLNRTGLRSVAFGTGETGFLVMPNVPQQADVSIGDVIVTSGLGDRFPPGFPVGEVASIERDSGQSFARAHVRPYAALDRGREVLVVDPYVPVVPPEPDVETGSDTTAEPGSDVESANIEALREAEPANVEQPGNAEQPGNVTQPESSEETGIESPPEAGAEVGNDIELEADAAPDSSAAADTVTDPELP